MSRSADLDILACGYVHPLQEAIIPLKNERRLSLLRDLASGRV